MNVTLYHYPRCSKSRETLALLRGRGIEPEIIEYLKTPPTTAELEAILAKLGLEPRELLRKGEAAYQEAGLDDPNLDRAAVIAAIVRHPVLMERPIVVTDEKARIGRPPERVLEIL